MGSPCLLLPHPIYQEILFVLSLKYIHMLYFHHPHTILSNDYLSLSLLQWHLTGLPASLSPPAICYSLSSLPERITAMPYSCSIQDPPRSSTPMYCKAQDHPTTYMVLLLFCLTSFSTFYLHFDHYALVTLASELSFNHARHTWPQGLCIRYAFSLPSLSLRRLHISCLHFILISCL